MPVGERSDVFAGVAADVPEALADHLRRVELIDHHVHGAFEKPVDRAGFEAAINEGSTDPVAVVHDAVRFAAGPFDPALVRTAARARTAWRTPTTIGDAAASWLPTSWPA